MQKKKLSQKKKRGTEKTFLGRRAVVNVPVEVLERIIDAAIREDDGGGGGELEEEERFLLLLLFPHRIEDVHRENVRSSRLCFSSSQVALPSPFSFFFSYLIVCEHSI